MNKHLLYVPPEAEWTELDSDSFLCTSSGSNLDFGTDDDYLLNSPLIDFGDVPIIQF